ncbi:hypothetical protein [uncultured Cetobacterium sp.]|uniref:hypothetical protein n=1 Tax=uncultured Cetobacterium sp. TaxID=527638 RepID=UPI00262E1B82|nr:hypothetical protein [uncultured Cetobacterium sp.]
MIKIDFSTGDVVLDKKKNFVKCNPYEEVVQRIQMKISLDKGDWFLSNEGIPWTSEIFKIKNIQEQKKLITYWIKKTIEKDPAFKEWKELDISIDENRRSFKIYWEIMGIDNIVYKNS